MRMRVLTVRGRTTTVGAVRTGPQGPPGDGGGGGGAVASVFGRTGAVVAEAGDYDVSQITDAVATDDARLSDARPPAVQAPITETGTTRTLSASDHGRTILCTHASGCAITVPHTLAPGTTVFVRRRGGAVTLGGSGGLTVTPPTGFTAALNGSGSGASVYVESATVAALDGDLAT